MDLDAYVAVHRPEWIRLGRLVERANSPSRMSGEELDELVELYQRAATHLSVIRSSSHDQNLVDDLASMVTRARVAVTGSRDPGWRSVGQFFVVTFPAAVYVRRWWAVATAIGFLLVSFVTALWLLSNPDAHRSLVAPDDVMALCNHDFAAYYSENPAGSFAAGVWTNNAWLSAQAIAFGVLLGIPTLFFLAFNAFGIGLSGGYLSGCGETEQFFALILPHGILELTVVFVAGAVGLRLGWSIIDPGPRRRVEALAAEGRAAVLVAVGLAVPLAVSGLVEAFVTPSGLPTFARITIGVVVWSVFVGYVWIYGRRAVDAGEYGDLDTALSADVAPVAA